MFCSTRLRRSWWYTKPSAPRAAVDGGDIRDVDRVRFSNNISPNFRVTVQRAGEERRGRAGPLDVLDSTRVKEFGVASIVEFEELELSGDVDFFFFFVVVVVVVSANVSRTPQNNFAIGITDGQMLPVW